MNVLNSAAVRGAISTGATGTFRAKIDEDTSTIHYELSYEGLEGTVTQAHIHFGQRHTVGGIVSSAQFSNVSLRTGMSLGNPGSDVTVAVLIHSLL